MSPGKTVCMLASLLALGCAATPGQCDAPMDCEDGLLAIDDAYVRISVTTTSAGNPNTNSGGEKRVRPWIEAIYGTSNLAEGTDVKDALRSRGSAGAATRARSGRCSGRYGAARTSRIPRSGSAATRRIWRSSCSAPGTTVRSHLAIRTSSSTTRRSGATWRRRTPRCYVARTGDDLPRQCSTHAALEIVTGEPDAPSIFYACDCPACPE